MVQTSPSISDQRAPIDLARASGGEDAEGQGAGSDALLARELEHEGGELGIRQRRMVLHGADPRRPSQELSRWPRQRAGFSPVRKPRAAAQSRMASTRWRTRVAVSVLASQIGHSLRQFLLLKRSECAVFKNVEQKHPRFTPHFRIDWVSCVRQSVGKFRPRGNDRGRAEWHPLVDHCADVAATPTPPMPT